MIVVYDRSCTYEVDYVEQLLEPIPHLINYVTTTELEARTTQCDILVLSSNVLTWPQCQTVVQRLKPKVILHLSEEEGTKPEFVQLSDMCNVVLRQHWFPSVYPHRHNLYQIPLGFMTNYKPQELRPHLAPHKRHYTWSFIGAVNLVRSEMLRAFNEHWPTKKHFVATNNIETSVMGRFYAQSVFVPNGRGCVRLDCFRFYEAILAGAIPVVAGSEQERKETFCFGNDFPPCVFGDTWKDALFQCDNLLQNHEELQNKQASLLDWFYRQVGLAQQRIRNGLDAPLAIYDK